MDLNLEYAAHQRALMIANVAANDDDRLTNLVKASGIAGRISDFNMGWVRRRHVPGARRSLSIRL